MNVQESVQLTPQLFAENLQKFFFDKLFKEGYSRSDIQKMSLTFSKFVIEQTINLPKEFLDQTLKNLNEC